MGNKKLSTTAITIRLPREVLAALDKIAPPGEGSPKGVAGGRAAFVRNLILERLELEKSND